jgi:hypothetical protein
MASPELAPTPVKVMNAAVLACLDDMFYRLPFPNLPDLERLIKEAQGEALMIEFQQGLRDELNTPRALNDFERGWDKYWKETQTPRQQAAAGQAQTESFNDRNRSPTPETPKSGGEGGPSASSAHASETVQ